MGEIDNRLNELRALERAAAERAENYPLYGGGGGGTSGDVTDDWKGSVDRQLGQLHEDVRALLNRGVAAVVALAVLIAGLYLYTNEKFERVDQRIAAVEVKLAEQNGKLDILLERTAPAGTAGVSGAAKPPIAEGK